MPETPAPAPAPQVADSGCQVDLGADAEAEALAQAARLEQQLADMRVRCSDGGSTAAGGSRCGVVWHNTASRGRKGGSGAGAARGYRGTAVGASTSSGRVGSAAGETPVRARRVPTALRRWMRDVGKPGVERVTGLAMCACA